MAQYCIQVYNHHRLGDLLKEGLMPYLLEANFDSLCNQYGLDPGLVTPALSQLELMAGPERVAPFYVLKYQPEVRPPLVVFQWDTDERTGTDRLGEAVIHVSDPSLRDRLRDTWEILDVCLQPEQLEGFGLVLAYEVARWAAFRGEGLVFGLDGTWYRLNRHQAFIPVEDSGQT